MCENIWISYFQFLLLLNVFHEAIETMIKYENFSRGDELQEKLQLRKRGYSCREEAPKNFFQGKAASKEVEGF